MRCMDPFPSFIQIATLKTVSRNYKGRNVKTTCDAILLTPLIFLHSSKTLYPRVVFNILWS